MAPTIEATQVANGANFRVPDRLRADVTAPANPALETVIRHAIPARPGATTESMTVYAASPLGLPRDPLLEARFLNGSVSAAKYNEIKARQVRDRTSSSHTPLTEGSSTGAYEGWLHRLDLIETAASHTIIGAEQRRRANIKPADERGFTVRNRTPEPLPTNALGPNVTEVTGTPVSEGAPRPTAELVLLTVPAAQAEEVTVPQIVDALLDADPRGGIVLANVPNDYVPVFEASQLGSVIDREQLDDAGRTAVFFRREDEEAVPLPAASTEAVDRQPVYVRPQTVNRATHRPTTTRTATAAEAAQFLSPGGHFSA